MEKGKLYSFEIKGWKEPICGIVEAFSVDWILIKWIINDFLFDGYSVIQRRHIKKCFQDENLLFKESVLRAKGVMDIPTPEIPIDSKSAPLKWFCDNMNIVLVSPIDESVCDVGKITKVLNRVFYLKTMDGEGKWDNVYDNCLLSEIVSFSIDTDYVKSLLIYSLKFEK